MVWKKAAWTHWGRLGQIENLNYDSDIIEEGYTDITKYSICFYKKECLVMKYQ